jgi:hypothetical protein
MEELNTIAQSRGGQLISKNYLGDKEYLTWECAEGHRWEAAPGIVKGTQKRKGTWCP